MVLTAMVVGVKVVVVVVRVLEIFLRIMLVFVQLPSTMFGVLLGALVVMVLIVDLVFSVFVKFLGI